MCQTMKRGGGGVLECFCQVFRRQGWRGGRGEAGQEGHVESAEMEAGGREEEDDVLQARVFAGSVAEGGGGTGAGDQYDHASNREVEGGCGGGESEDHGEGEAM